MSGYRSRAHRLAHRPAPRAAHDSRMDPLLFWLVVVPLACGYAFGSAFLRRRR